jgi:acyl carrier protein
VKSVDVRTEVISQFNQVALENEKQLATLEDSTLLLESGLDSLCFAIVVVRLEVLFGVDPFSMSEDTRFPLTFGEFVRFYENAAS